MRIDKTNRSGFTLLEIMIIVGIIGLLAAIAIPTSVKARATSRTNACINNLRQIDAAKLQWALELKQPSTASPDQGDIQPFLGRGSAGNWPTCPASGIYTIGNLSTAPSCSVAGHALTY